MINFLFIDAGLNLEDLIQKLQNDPGCFDSYVVTDGENTSTLLSNHVISPSPGMNLG